HDPRSLLTRPQLYELISELGFIRVFSVYNDFVYAPLTRRLVWLLRNLSIVLENAPGLRSLAGAILVHAQKPPRLVERTETSLFGHEPLRRAVSVVIPCHNEEMNIGPLVTRLRNLFDEYLCEIIPVDDNSTDRTADVLRGLAAEDDRVKPVFRSPPNGVGRAIADGYRAATGRYVLSMDCDFQHLLPEVRDLFDSAAMGYDVVVGSRFSRHSVLLNYPFQKILANRGFHVLAQLLLRSRFRDLTNNLKLIRHEVIERLELVEPGFAANAEIGLQPLLMGYRVQEVPISWVNRTPDMGNSSFRLVRVGGGYGRVLYRLWLRCVFGVGAYRALPHARRVRQTDRAPNVPPVPAGNNCGVERSAVNSGG
ncbi:MAG: glycosyltransferase family 2 protein, partial [Thermoleophilaceae bacterium]